MEIDMNILIIGAKGQLGYELQKAGQERQAAITALDLPEFNMTESRKVAALFDNTQFNAVINAAAYTAVDKAEVEKETAFAVNAEAPGHLATACQKASIPLLHVSTDYVFDGKMPGAYRETDTACPIGVYGASKFAGEEVIRKNLQNHLIVRTAWLYGVHGNNFVKTMLGLFKIKERLSVVDDQVGCPTDAKELALAMWSMLDKFERGLAIQWGTYHYCGAGAVSWCGFARKILELGGSYKRFQTTGIDPIPSEAYPTPAHRPANSVLDCSKIAHNFGIVPRAWEDSLSDMLARHYATESEGQ